MWDRVFDLIPFFFKSFNQIPGIRDLLSQSWCNYVENQIIQIGFSFVMLFFLVICKYKFTRT